MDVRDNAREVVITLVSLSPNIVIIYCVAGDGRLNNHCSCYRLTKNVRVNRLTDRCWKMLLIYLLRLVWGKWFNMSRILRYRCLMILPITTKVRLQTGLRLTPAQNICWRQACLHCASALLYLVGWPALIPLFVDCTGRGMLEKGEG